MDQESDLYILHVIVVILDDDTDMLLEQKDNFINTNGFTGLTKEDAFKAVNILNTIP